MPDQPAVAVALLALLLTGTTIAGLYTVALTGSCSTAMRKSDQARTVTGSVRSCEATMRKQHYSCSSSSLQTFTFIHPSSYSNPCAMHHMRVYT